jgi:hypothetical protein
MRNFTVCRVCVCVCVCVCMYVLFSPPDAIRVIKLENKFGGLFFLVMGPISTAAMNAYCTLTP